MKRMGKKTTRAGAAPVVTSVVTPLLTALIAPLIALAAAGGGSFPGVTPETGVVNAGFPLIDIVDAEVTITDTDWSEKETWTRNPGTVIIGGVLGKEIRPRDLTIRLIETEIRVPIDEDDDLSAWFLNMPLGMTATVVDGVDPENADDDHAVVTVRIAGAPEQTINQPIKIKVPYQYTNRSWDFLIPPDEDKRFEVYGVDIAPVVVGGAVTTRIDSKTFTLKFGGTRLANAMRRGADVTSWFTNIPRGLSASLAEDAVPAREGQQTVLVTISGTPSMQSRESMRVTVPAMITECGAVIEAAPSALSRYDVGSFEGITFDVDKWDSATLNNHWDGNQPWETGGLDGPKPYALKDFDSVGVIQITAKAKYSLREDGKYHWEGDAITYGALMAEAKKLGAHAIINVVVDYKDHETHSTARRQVEAGHAPTPVERAKHEAGILTVEVAADGSEIYIEDIREIERTYTGTALAIKWAPAYSPAEGEAGSGYTPATPEYKKTDTWPALIKEVVEEVIDAYVNKK